MQIRKMSPKPPVEWSSEMGEIEIQPSLFLNENFNHLLRRRCVLAVVPSKFQTDGKRCVAALCRCSVLRRRPSPCPSPHLTE